jgi:hypothetical protein
VARIILGRWPKIEKETQIQEKPTMSLIPWLLLGTYVWFGWKFWSGYKNTNFAPDLVSRLLLTLGWPALLAINPAYRRNFQKALKGRNY